MTRKRREILNYLDQEINKLQRILYSSKVLVKDLFIEFDLWVVLAELTLVKLVFPVSNEVFSLSSEYFRESKKMERSRISVIDFEFYFLKTVQTCSKFINIYPRNLDLRLQKLKPIIVRLSKERLKINWKPMVLSIEKENHNNWKQKIIFKEIHKHSTTFVKNNSEPKLCWFIDSALEFELILPNELFLIYFEIFQDYNKKLQNQAQLSYFVYRIAFNLLVALKHLIDKCFQEIKKNKPIPKLINQIWIYFLEKVEFNSEMRNNLEKKLQKNVYYNSMAFDEKEKKIVQEGVIKLEDEHFLAEAVCEYKLKYFFTSENKIKIYDFLIFLLNYVDSNSHVLSSTSYQFVVFKMVSDIYFSLIQIEQKLKNKDFKGWITVSCIIAR